MPQASVTVLQNGPNVSWWNAREVKTEPAHLLLHRGEYLRVAVALVQGRIGSQHVEVTLPFNVLDPHALALGQDDRQRQVIVGAVCISQTDVIRLFTGTPFGCRLDVILAEPPLSGKPAAGP